MIDEDSPWTLEIKLKLEDGATDFPWNHISLYMPPQQLKTNWFGQLSWLIPILELFWDIQFMIEDIFYVIGFGKNECKN